jgi:hypothetical protein
MKYLLKELEIHVASQVGHLSGLVFCYVVLSCLVLLALCCQVKSSLV